MAKPRLTLCALLLVTAGVRAQAPGEEPPRRLNRPPAESELRAREAKAKFALAVLHQRRDRALEAVRLLEEAARLDPAAAAPRKALSPLYLLIGRADDAVTVLREALDRDPGDAVAWHLLAGMLRDRNDLAGAAAAWERGAACPAAADKPALLLRMLLKLGQARERLRDFAAAEAAYRRAARLLDDQRARFLEVGVFSAAEWEAEAVSALEAAGRSCAAAGRHADAAEAYRQAQAKSAGDPARSARLNWRLAEVLAAQGRPDESLQTLRPYLAQRPANLAAFELLVRLLRQTGRGDQVISVMTAAAREQPEFQPLHLLLARELAAANRSDEADALFRDLAKRAPTADLYGAWFADLRRRDRPSVALNLLDSALARSADEENASQAEREAAGEQARAMAQALRAEPDLIKELVTEALREPPPRREKRAADTLRTLAGLAKQTRQLAAAEALLREAMVRANDDAQGEVFDLLIGILWQQRKREEVVALCAGDLRGRRFWRQTYLNYHLARAYDELGRSTEALRAIDVAIGSRQGQGDLTQPFLRCRRAQILQHAGRFAEAASECEELLKLPLKPDQAREVRLALAGIYGAAREHAKAEALLRLILEADPSDPLANNNLGYHLADLGQDLAEAERLVRKAIDLDREERRRGASADEDTPAYLDSLGWVLFRRGRYEEARQWLERAGRLPDGEHDPVVWDHLGDTYARLGEPAKARAAWAKALPLYASERRQAGDERSAEVRRKIATGERP